MAKGTNVSCNPSLQPNKPAPNGFNRGRLVLSSRQERFLGVSVCKGEAFFPLKNFPNRLTVQTRFALWVLMRHGESITAKEAHIREFLRYRL